MVLPGSIRENLDIFGAHCTDEMLLSALAEVGLQDMMDTRGGLDNTEASTLSSGQQQLLCLARALLRDTQILILDEATSNVDADTESKIVGLVHERFRHRTVIAVAHRLRTIVDFDTVFVLDQGQVIEQGNPRDLLAIEGSRFREMWNSQQQQQQH